MNKVLMKRFLMHIRFETRTAIILQYDIVSDSFFSNSSIRSFKTEKRVVSQSDVMEYSSNSKE